MWTHELAERDTVSVRDLATPASAAFRGSRTILHEGTSYYFSDVAMRAHCRPVKYLEAAVRLINTQHTALQPGAPRT